MLSNDDVYWWCPLLTFKVDVDRYCYFSWGFTIFPNYSRFVCCVRSSMRMWCWYEMHLHAFEASASVWCWTEWCSMIVVVRWSAGNNWGIVTKTLWVCTKRLCKPLNITNRHMMQVWPSKVRPVLAVAKVQDNLNVLPRLLFSCGLFWTTLFSITTAGLVRARRGGRVIYFGPGAVKHHCSGPCVDLNGGASGPAWPWTKLIRGPAGLEQR